MPDIMISFEYAAYDYGLDFSVDEHNVYKSEKTRKAFFWYQKGFIHGERA